MGKGAGWHPGERSCRAAGVAQEGLSLPGRETGMGRCMESPAGHRELPPGDKQRVAGGAGRLSVPAGTHPRAPHPRAMMERGGHTDTQPFPTPPPDLRGGGQGGDGLQKWGQPGKR